MIAAIYARKSTGDCETRTRAGTWVALTIAFGLLVGLITGVGTYRAAPGVSAWATGLTAALLASTFFAILWYSWETHRLVDAQQEASEIARHPWLSATALAPKHRNDTLVGPVDLWLPIENHGDTPAYFTRIEVTGTEQHFSPREPVSGQVIVPGDVLHLRLGAVMCAPGPETAVKVMARMRYRTADGGHGDLTVGFEYLTPSGGWENLDTHYRFMLSTGKAFPLAVADPGEVLR